MPKRTVNQIAEKLGVPRDAAYNLVLFLQALKLVEKAGEEQRPAGTKGKAAGLYEPVVDIAERLQKVGVALSE